MQHIVKSGGHSEPYEQRKLYASIYSVCVAVREPKGTAELLAAKVCEDVEAWLADKHEVTSTDIRRMAASYLISYNHDAGWLYTHHRNFA